MDKTPPKAPRYLVSIIAAMLAFGLLWFNSRLSQIVIAAALLAVITGVIVVTSVSFLGNRVISIIFITAIAVGVLSVGVLIYYDLFHYGDYAAALIKSGMLYGHIELYRYKIRRGKQLQ
ncbi:hypothetical protein [Solemya elarraichensis gill symbiont]|uniref:Uncharacterized protein n=1 Tax=Solemya elarraichensis gill symbiont TaxID=1918949 RepID=A0A1T2KZL0_9GAMM|nr:hypothetical protein [Solemya elarraichensis gill symbiont]OOZ38279.1 hypothetical protein BOW52_08895 [Solemya elarraichensis gill symbiont]